MITLERHAIDVSVENRYATIEYQFNFTNYCEIENKSNEIKFDITINPNAFISKFTANIDNEIFIGKVKEKEQASNEYKQAKINNENTILISQTHKDISNVFTISTNINSQSWLFLTITIEQYLTKRFDFNYLDLEILRNFTKRIIPRYETIPITFNINEESGIYDLQISNIDASPQYLDKAQTKASIKYRIDNDYDDKINEVTLKYKLKGEEDQSMILLNNKTGSFVHIIPHNAALNDGSISSPIPRRVVFVIDRSLSMMNGNKWTQMKQALFTAITQLRHDYDRFAVILFAADNQIIYDGFIKSNQEINREIIEYINNIPTSGGTNINDVLITAMNLIQDDIESNTDYLNQLIFITDGEITIGQRDTHKIISNIKQFNNKLDNKHKVSIFSFGIGSDANDSLWTKDLGHSFLKSLSINNYGFYKRIKQRMTNDTLSQYFRYLSQPLMRNIEIKYETGNETKMNITELTATKINALYSGCDLIVAGRVTGGNLDDIDDGDTKFNASIHGEYGDKEGKSVSITNEIKLSLHSMKDTKTIDKIWAYLKLQQFAANRLKIFNDMIEMDEDEQKEADKVPLKLALKYGFVTPWTSMIVVKKKNPLEIMNKSDKTSISAPSIPHNPTQDPFTTKVQEIEQKIIQHLHQRGYNDSHPDYLRYLQKSKELALKKSNKHPKMSNNTSQRPAPPGLTGKVSQEFINKVKEIEHRVIKHLHQRGFDESHPDYHRYLQKAKELAIKKANEQLKKHKAKRRDYEHLNVINNCQLQRQPRSQPLNPMPRTRKGLIVLRGLPGSGKTTLARKLALRCKNSIICSEDKYHWSGKQEGVGIFKFNPALVYSAREWCGNEIRSSIDSNEYDLIVIDNHNAKTSMYEPFIKYAVSKGFNFRIIEFTANKELIIKYRNRSKKTFSIEIYEKLLKLWEDDHRAELFNSVFDTNQRTNNIRKCIQPTTYEVIMQARVRSDTYLESEWVTDLPEGSIICVVEIDNNRARICKPVCGWLSVKTRGGNGRRIIIPKNVKEFNKIGGKVQFKEPIYGQPFINNYYPKNADIIDYDERKKLYLVKYINGSQQWINLTDPRIVYIDKRYNHNNNKSKHGMDATATEFRMQTNESFFNQFFRCDYPAFEAGNDSTIEKMNIKNKI